MPAPTLQALDRRVRAEPAAVLDWLCAGAAAPDDQLLAAEALLELSREAQADGLLAGLAAAAQATPSPPWAARWFVVQGLRLGAAGKTAESLAALEQARAGLHSSGQATSRLALRTAVARGLRLRRLAQVDAAQAAADEAEALLAPLGLSVSLEATDVLNLRTLIAYARQDLPATLRLAEAEIDMLGRLGLADSPDAMYAWSSRGATLSQLGRHAQARAAYERGLAIARAHPDTSPFGHQGLLNNLATEHLALGEAEPALARAEQALQLGLTTWGEGSARLLRPLTSIGTAHHMAARYGQALASYERAQALAERQGTDAGLHLQLELTDLRAGALHSLGDREAALAVVEAGLRANADRPHTSFWQGRLLIRRAGLRAQAGDWAAVEADAAEAVRLVGAVQGTRHAVVVEWGAVRCRAQLQAGLAATACEALAVALPTLDSAAPFRRHRALSALAEHAASAGRADEAEARLFAALAAARAQGGPDPLWTALDALAQQQRRQGRPALAVFFGKQAVQAIEQQRREVAQHAPANEDRFVASRGEVYRRLAAWLAEDGRLPEALDTLRRLREDEFHDFTQRDGRLAGATPQPLELSTAEQALVERWQALPSGSAEAEWAQQARALVAEMAATGLGVAGVPAALSRLQTVVVPPGELQVHAIAGPQRLTLLLLGAARREVQQIDWPAAQQGREVGALLAAMARREDTRPLLRALHIRLGTVLEDAARSHSASRVVLHLDGSLRYLPVASLHDGRRFLGERLVVEHRHADMAAATAATAAAETPASAGTALSVRALGVSQALAGRPALPGVAQEVCAIVDGPVHGLAAPGCGSVRGAVPGEGWLDAGFTAEQLAHTLAETPPAQHRSLLHVGTHFDLRPGAIERSTLLLGDGRLLTLAQLAEHRFDGQALVTLSACETGLGGATGADGREVAGLNTTLLRRGAGAVLASLWRVDDASTGALMAAFYRELRRLPPAQALQQAQRQVRANPRWASPFHWAGFTVTTRAP